MATCRKVCIRLSCLHIGPLPTRVRCTTDYRRWRFWLVVLIHSTDSLICCALSRRHAVADPHQERLRSPGGMRVSFLFRARERAPSRSNMRAPLLHRIPHRPHPHALAHARTAARLIALLCTVVASCFPRTSQVISLRGFGARPSSWAFWMLSAPAARAGGLAFARFGSSIGRFCRGAFR